MRQDVAWRFEVLSECLLCGGTRLTPTFSRSIRSVPLDFVTCDDCGLRFQNPRFTRESLADYFSSLTFIRDSGARDYRLDEPLGYHDYEDWDASYKATAALRLRRILRYKKAPARLLEIGTATGSFLDVARSHGFTVHGLDVSTRLSAMARQRYGLDIDVDFIEDAQLPAASYDVVCNFGGIACWRDPVRALKNIRSALAPGGIFVMNFPNASGVLARLYGDRYPEFNHASLTIFSSTTMKQCLAAAGFSLVLAENERQVASIGRIVTYLKSAAGRWLAHRLGIDRMSIPVIAFGTIFAVCKPHQTA